VTVADSAAAVQDARTVDVAKVTGVGDVGRLAVAAAWPPEGDVPPAVESELHGLDIHPDGWHVIRR